MKRIDAIYFKQSEQSAKKGISIREEAVVFMACWPSSPPEITSRARDHLACHPDMLNFASGAHFLRKARKTWGACIWGDG